MTANQFYENLVKEIAVDPEEIESAKNKRDELAAIVKDVLRGWGLAGAKSFPTGAVAMGTVIAPLDDIDFVVVTLARRPHWASDPKAALDEIAGALQARLPGCKVEASAHAVKVTFPDEGFTADVVYGVESGDHLLIPHCPRNEPRSAWGWIKTNPAAHAALVRQANKDYGYEFARMIRILKALNRKWGMDAEDEKKPLSSWHLTALALTFVNTKVSYATTIPDLLDQAAAAALGTLPDPTGVGPGLTARDPARASALLADAARRCRNAASSSDAERILRPLFGDPAAVVAAVTGKPTSYAAGALLVGTAGRTGPAVRSYGDAT